MRTQDTNTHYVGLCGQGISALTMWKNGDRGYQHSMWEFVSTGCKHSLRGRMWPGYISTLCGRMWAGDISTRYVGECGQAAALLMLPPHHQHHTHEHKQGVFFSRYNLVSSGVGNISLSLDTFYFRHNTGLLE
jgi:hypothetical protein